MQNKSRLTKIDSFNIFSSTLVVFYTNFHNNYVHGSSVFTIYKNIFPSVNGFFNLASNGLISNLLGLLPYDGTFSAIRIFLGSLLLIYSLKQIQVFLLQYLDTSFVLLLSCLLVFTPNNYRVLDLFFNTEVNMISGSFFAQFPYPSINLFGFSLILQLFRKTRIGQLPKTIPTLFVILIEFAIHPFLALLLIFAFLFRSLTIYCSNQVEDQTNRSVFWKTFSTILFTFLIISFLLVSDSNSALGSIDLNSEYKIDQSDLIIYTIFPILVFFVSINVANISTYEISKKLNLPLSFFVFDVLIFLISYISNIDLSISYKATGISYVIHLLIYAPVLFMLLRFRNLQKIRFINQIYLSRLITQFTKYIKLSGLAIAVFTLFSYLIGVNNFSKEPKPTCSLVYELADDFSKVQATDFRSQARTDFLLENLINRNRKDEFRELMKTPTPGMFQSSQKVNCPITSLGFLLLNGTNFSSEAFNIATELVRVSQ